MRRLLLSLLLIVAFTAPAYADGGTEIPPAAQGGGTEIPPAADGGGTEIPPLTAVLNALSSMFVPIN